MIKVFEIILCMYLKTISPDVPRFTFVCSIYNLEDGHNHILPHMIIDATGESGNYISTEIKQCHIEDGHSHITPHMMFYLCRYLVT
jgi:hypothetical protein